jgi:hypothetical protein
MSPSLEVRIHHLERRLRWTQRSALLSLALLAATVVLGATERAGFATADGDSAEVIFRLPADE